MNTLLALFARKFGLQADFKFASYISTAFSLCELFRKSYFFRCRFFLVSSCSSFSLCLREREQATSIFINTSMEQIGELLLHS